MNPEAMKPFGLALLDYHRGNREATLFLYREGGRGSQQRAAIFFRDADEIDIERKALELCRGRVLDAGAGAGIHSLYLQERGFDVISIDVSSEAVQVMRESGVKNALVADLMTFKSGPFDTVLMMCHGIGMMENLGGLDEYLARVPELVNHDGQVLLTSLDVRQTADPENLAYHEYNRKAGRYIGEVRMKLRYGELEGPFCGWLQVDPETLTEHASAAGLVCEIIQRSEDGNYLARLMCK